MNKPFDIHRLYRTLDKWKLLHRKQINMKHTLKQKYSRLQYDYKNLLITNAKLKSEVRTLRDSK
jgi:hypothetical protein